MKKLLQCNAILYAAMYSLSLIYAGFRVGATYDLYYGPDFDFFLFPLVYFILFMIGCYLIKGHWYASGKSYCAMAIITPVVISVPWGIWLTCRFQDLQEGIPDTIFWDIIVYPAVLFLCSVLISIIYFVCAIKARKDNQDYIY